jgi:hypothetical protein
MPNNKIIEGRHKVYLRYNGFWDFLLDSYEGGIDYTRAFMPISHNHSGVVKIYVNGKQMNDERTRSNLFMHPKETNESYSSRVEMSYYYNFCQPIVDIYTNHLFKDPVVEDFGSLSMIIERVYNDIDGAGTSIPELRREICDLIQIYGHCFCLVENSIVNNLISLDAALKQKSIPLIRVLQPQDVLNWELDDLGNPLWVLIRVINDNVCSYRLITRDSYIVYDKDGVIIKEEDNHTGQVPIKCFFDKKSKKHKNFFGISAIADISFISRDIYNLCSSLNQIIRDQTFSFLAIQGDVSDYQGDNSIGTRKGLIYPLNTNVPQYVAPDRANADVIMSQIDRQVQKIYQMARIDGGSAEQLQQVVSQSGVSKAFDFHETNSALVRKSNNMADAENSLWGLYAMSLGRVFDGNINYSSNFSVSSLNDDIEEAVSFGKLAIGNTFKSAVYENIIRKKFPRREDSEIKKMIKDMEEELLNDNSGNNSLFNRLSI